MESSIITSALQAGGLGVLIVTLLLFFQHLRREQDFKERDIISREKLATAISKMNEGSLQVVAILKDMQVRCTSTQEKCQESTRFLGDFVKDLKHGVKVDS